MCSRFPQEEGLGMSSIYGLSGANSDLTLRQAMARQSESSDSRRADFEAKFNSAAQAAGLDPQAVSGLQDEIKSAVDAATQSSSGTSDRRQVVQNAIDGVLQKHGVDLAKFNSQMQSMGGPSGAGGPPPRGGPGGAGGPPPSGGSPGGAGGTDFQSKFKEAAVAAGLDEDEADSLQDDINSTIDNVLKNSDGQSDTQQAVQAAIDKLLTDHGVDLQQFKSELQASVGGASSETIPLVDTQA